MMIDYIAIYKHLCAKHAAENKWKSGKDLTYEGLKETMKNFNLSADRLGQSTSSLGTTFNSAAFSMDQMAKIFKKIYDEKVSFKHILGIIPKAKND